MNSEQIRKIYSRLGLLQIVLFVPFFFASGGFILQLIDDYKILTHYNKYKPGVFIVLSQDIQDYQTDYGGSSAKYFVGIVDGIHTEVSAENVRLFISKTSIHLNDTIYVWYRNDGKMTLPRFKNENNIKLSRYLHPYLRSLMLFGIPPFIVLTIIMKRIKRKYLTIENK